MFYCRIESRTLLTKLAQVWLTGTHPETFTWMSNLWSFWAQKGKVSSTMHRKYTSRSCCTARAWNRPFSAQGVLFESASLESRSRIWKVRKMPSDMSCLLAYCSILEFLLCKLSYWKPKRKKYTSEPKPARSTGSSSGKQYLVTCVFSKESGYHGMLVFLFRWLPIILDLLLRAKENLATDLDLKM